ncbi:MerR family transcriptional regulator [Hydrogenophaga sp.]|uniref:MerR family transcriptional regulator n=1 Tax=Hydrogenophaga sp. TaxID=1904254 RepID=UPI00286D9AB2|nr:MerR family transcriptional regulator [Hydrogenophaga sp.]
MKISELARLSNVSVHRLRRYETLGLLQAGRSPSGHRDFASGAVREAIFIAMSRDLGFSLERVAEVLPRYRAGTLSFDDMKAFMEERIAEVDAALAEQRALRRRLVQHVRWLTRRKATFARRREPKNPFTLSERSKRQR